MIKQAMFLLIALLGSCLVSRADELADLQAQRIETLQQAVGLIEAQYRGGAATVEQLLDAQAELLDARLDAASRPEQRIDILTQQLKLSAIAEKVAESRLRAGAAKQSDLLLAKAARLRVEIRLLKSKQHDMEDSRSLGHGDPAGRDRVDVDEASVDHGAIRDTHNFRELFGELKQTVLPSGWSIAESFDAKSESSEPRPALVITSDGPLPFEHVEIGAPGSLADEPEQLVAMQTVEIRLAVMPYMSPDQRAAAAAQNERSRQQRLEFEQRRLMGIPFAWKGPRPFPPEAYDPDTLQQQALRREYAFTWRRTEPVPLPSHYYRTLAFQMQSSPWGTIRNEHKMIQFKDLLGSIQQVAIPYDKAASGEFVGD